MTKRGGARAKKSRANQKGFQKRKTKSQRRARVRHRPRCPTTRRGTASKHAHARQSESSMFKRGSPSRVFPSKSSSRTSSEKKICPDLAHLRGVSRGMRDAVDATGRRIKELDEYTALDLGYVTTLRCLQRRGRLSRKEFLCHAAARSGQLEELKALRAESCPWTVYTCQAAATGGHLEVLQWARANGCTWNKHTCAVAAEGGHLNVLQWARENGCPWDEETCTGAAKSGHLEVLQWARLNGCPWGESTCDGAVVGGHLKLMLWAHANGCPWKGGRARNWRQRTDTLR